MNAIVKFVSPAPRLDRIRDAVHAAGYSLCLERPRLLLQFRRSREGCRLANEHVCVHRAAAIAHVLRHRQPRIHDDELVIGNITSKRVAANYYPEGSSAHIVEDLFRLDERVVPLRLSAREKAELLAIAVATSRDSVLWHALATPTRLRHVWDILHAERYIVTEQAGVGHQVGNHARVIKEGLEGSVRIAEACLASGTTPDGMALDDEQRAFYRSIIIIADGIRTMAANLAGEATRMAARPGTTPERRQELEAAASALRHVPYHPARTFREGVQAAWIMHMAMCLEDYEQGVSFGRLDQPLQRLYEQDVAKGIITRDDAVEFVASFQLKCCEAMPVYSTRMDHYFSGHDVAQGITLGGVDAAGHDATGEVSGIFLDAYAQIATREPSLHVRVHDATPSWFLDKCIETLQRTGTRPAFYGDKTVIAALMKAGYSEAHARDYAVIGCTELASQGRTANSADAALMNLPLCLEQALNEGRNFRGKRQGAMTPPVTAMRSMEDVIAAYRTQVKCAVDDMAKVMGYLEEAVRQHRTTPVNSLMTDGCLQRGRDITSGSADYNFTSVQAVGLADAGDSLHAIYRLVFAEKRFTLPQLVEILRNDFKGHEALAIEMQRKLPRFGNGHAEADRWVQVAADAFCDAVATQRSSRGGQWLAGFYSMTCGHAFGRYTGALPDGRRAGARMSNGCSPVDGMDRNGPSALFRSVAGLDKSRWANSQVLNATFDRKTIGGKQGAAKLASLLRTYFLDQNGMQVQIAVLNADDLRKARANPEAYPNLLVRVSGYCAYFADLRPEVQDEIIERTMHA